MNRPLLFLLCCFAAAASACNEHNGYVPTEGDRRTVSAYASLALLYDSFPATASRDSLTLYHERADSVLRQFGFSRDEFQREFENLINSPERFQPLFEELSKEIRKGMKKG